jgi:hypothetical protein
MMNIRKVNELFDDEDLKSRFEIPYIKGDLGDDVMKWKKASDPIVEETPETLHKKLLFRFPILGYFNEEKSTLPEGQDVYCNYISSSEPASDGNKYYAQLVTSFDNNIYYINVILRDIRDYENREKWVMKDLQFDNIDDVYEFIRAFLTSCENLGIITPRQKHSIESN